MLQDYISRKFKNCSRFHLKSYIQVKHSDEQHIIDNLSENNVWLEMKNTSPVNCFNNNFCTKIFLFSPDDEC